MAVTGIRLQMRIALAVFLAALAVSCGAATGTAELVGASFVTAGQSAIDLLSPVNGDTVLAYPSFSWSAKAGSSYRIEIATDANFSAKIVDKEVRSATYQVSDADLIGLSTLPSATFYWRVSVPRVTPSLASTAFRVTVLPGSIV